MEYALSLLRNIHSLSDAFVRDLGTRIRRLEPKKNATLLLPGDICQNIFFIEEGMLACYDIEGRKRYCSWIMIKGDFVTSVKSFNLRVPSTEEIIALTKCRLLA